MLCTTLLEYYASSKFTIFLGKIEGTKITKWSCHLYVKYLAMISGNDSYSKIPQNTHPSLKKLVAEHSRKQWIPIQDNQIRNTWNEIQTLHKFLKWLNKKYYGVIYPISST